MKWIAAVAVTLLAGRLAAAPVPFADPPEIRSANGVLDGHAHDRADDAPRSAASA